MNKHIYQHNTEGLSSIIRVCNRPTYRRRFAVSMCLTDRHIGQIYSVGKCGDEKEEREAQE